MPIIKIVPMPGPGGTGSADIADFTFATVQGEGDESTMTIHNHDMRIQTTRDEEGIDSDIEINSADDVWITANDTVEISSISDNVVVFTNDFEHQWNFLNNGDLQFPDGTIQTTAYTGGSTLGIKTINWQYPTEGATAIQNSIDGEAISLKSSNSAALRWHVRDGGHSTAGWSIQANSILQQTGELGVGPYQAQFSIETLDFVPPTGYYYNVNHDGPWAGAYICTASTNSTITLEYPGPNLPGANEEFTGGNIFPPSIYNQVEADEDGVWIKNADWSSGPGSYSNYWQFTKDGSIHFPYGPSNNRTGSGDVLRFASSLDQSIITGAPPTTQNPTANRLVIAGQDGVAGEGWDGEGGDIYLWAGRGGGTTGDGGDIKIDAGNGEGTGEGGYVKIRGGYSQDSEGGFINIDAGSSSNGAGGSVTINAGSNYVDMEQYGGSVSINAGSSGNAMGGGSIVLSTSQAGKITLNGDGGEYLNSVEPGNQIATVSQLPTGATGSFTSADGKTITVTNGIITGIE
jgi:hypothetical protein